MSTTVNKKAKKTAGRRKSTAVVVAKEAKIKTTPRRARPTSLTSPPPVRQDRYQAIAERLNSLAEDEKRRAAVLTFHARRNLHSELGCACGELDSDGDELQDDGDDDEEDGVMSGVSEIDWSDGNEG